MLEIDLSYNYSLNNYTGLTKSRYPVVFMQKIQYWLKLLALWIDLAEQQQKDF